jgi:hypothetical protein
VRIKPGDALKRALIRRHGVRWAIKFTLYIRDDGSPTTGLPDPQCCDRTYAAQLNETWESLREAIFWEKITVFDRNDARVPGPEWLMLGEVGFSNGYAFDVEEFENWARPKRGGSRPKAWRRADLPQEYRSRIDDLIARGESSTQAQDAKWGEAKGVPRERMRQLRREFIASDVIPEIWTRRGRNSAG